jgi:phage terminase large subunit-like protein
MRVLPSVSEPKRLDLGAVGRAIEASLLQESLTEFAKASWHVLEPQTPLKWGWALDAICQHLEAITSGDITHLLINVPPGCMKSLLTGVIFPAWEWTLHVIDPKTGAPRYTHRSMRYLGTSHKQELAVRDNMKCRRLIQSRWYQERWPCPLTTDQNAKLKFENTETGFREAMAFTSMTGSRGDRVIVDDPLSVDDGNSAAALKSAELTFTEALPTRVNNEDSAIIVIMQRLNEDDTSGIILKRDLGYEHLMLPMEFESKRRCKTSLGFVDPRKHDGDLLFPTRFSATQVASLKKVLGKYATAGQLQQSPTPRGGGLFEEGELRLWGCKRDLPNFLFVVQSYDTAFTEETANDPTACSTWGVFEHKSQRCALLLDSWDDRMEFPELRRRVLKDWKAKYGGKDGDDLQPGRRADAVLIENKGSGISLIQDLRAARVPALPYNPGNADKWSRAQQALPLYELNLFFVIESKAEQGQAVTWARPFIKQLTDFGPSTVKGDDYVDTFTQVAIYLRDCGWLELPVVEEDPVKEKNYGVKKRDVNPYMR